MNDSSEPRKAASSPDDYMPMPRSSRTAMGCLVLPALLGGLMLLLLLFVFCGDAYVWIMSWLGHPGERPKLGFTEFDPLTIALCIVPIWAFRAMLAETRKPWVYWLVVIWMTLAALGQLGCAWFKITWPFTNSNIGPIVGQWILAIFIFWVLCWFAFSKENRQYYRISKSS